MGWEQASKRVRRATRPRRATVIVAAGVLLVAVVVGAIALSGQRRGQSGTTALSSSSSIRSGRSAEQLALPSTAGADLRLAQMRGAPLVVYFYEGAS